MDWKLELVVLPVSDIDRAKAFYADRVGFHVDVDHRAGDFRVVQLTPPGSACSVTLLSTTDMVPGSIHGRHLVVEDIESARAELLERGVEAGDVFHFESGGQRPGADPSHADYNSFVSFADPDGNVWMVQEVRSRGRGV